MSKAALLLYFVVKDHPFSAGNKRSAAALFTYYLSMNSVLQRGNGEDVVSSNALAAITLVTAMSKPEEKETIIQLVTKVAFGDGCCAHNWGIPKYPRSLP